MLRAADADGAVVELLRVLLGVGDELGQRLRRQLGIDHDHVRQDREQRDRREILLRVVAERLEQRPVRRQRTDRAHHQRVAVGRRSDRRQSAGIAAGARAVVDDERLPERLRHPVEHDAGDDVAGAAAREGHDHLDRPCRIILGVRARRPPAAAAAAANATTANRSVFFLLCALLSSVDRCRKSFSFLRTWLGCRACATTEP